MTDAKPMSEKEERTIRRLWSEFDRAKAEMIATPDARTINNFDATSEYLKGRLWVMCPQILSTLDHARRERDEARGALGELRGEIEPYGWADMWIVKIDKALKGGGA